jgi:hypothetical protein
MINDAGGGLRHWRDQYTSFPETLVRAMPEAFGLLPCLAVDGYDTMVKGA